ncbi:hypothetical protein AC578_133 [Pseudocercospora eumusae]|uniref:Uncharacterized protein n=1 Tax=Pseudocercospora eumusae TaxID=321146 RepID=A0A139GXV0_9PEZI|nr:hypothetical protein AC578_133 [Pseudocercospora eumusae]
MKGSYETTCLIEAAECEATVGHGKSGNHPDEERELELYIRDYSVYLNEQQSYSHDSLVRAAETEGKQYFVEIPADLRNEIYRLVIPTRTVRWFDPSEPRENRISFREPAVLIRINRQVRDEAWPIFYKENKFIFRIRAMDASTLVK